MSNVKEALDATTPFIYKVWSIVFLLGVLETLALTIFNVR